ncbi:MAG: ATP phosphoribosyltransferase [Dehalococcoidales bacterium]
MAIKIALPKGRLLRKTAAMLQKAEWGLDEYQSNMGFYRPKSQKFPELLVRVFHEKDIPIQIAMGNYDLGICGLDWIEELLAKYPSSDIVNVRDLLYGEGSLYLAAAALPQSFKQNGTPLRIASEYPNLAEIFALKQRLSRFSVFPLWGAAEAYPPENADMVLLSAGSPADLAGCGLMPVKKLLDFSTCLIAHRSSWETKNLEKIVTSIFKALPETCRSPAEKKDIAVTNVPPGVITGKIGLDIVRLALPDGHQQQQTVELLTRAGIKIDDYPSESGNRRPEIGMDGFKVKVIRPQDMPLQVANGNFDLAITGRDWLADHLAQFPSSPAREIINLKLRKVRLVAVVSQDIPVTDTDSLRQYITVREEPLRLASEYVNIADKYARENHLGHYHVIPTWGATEAFLPDDADLLIENTETGRTIARHNLKIIDTLFESTACLIGNKATPSNPRKKERMATFVEKLIAVMGDK